MKRASALPVIFFLLALGAWGSAAQARDAAPGGTLARPQGQVVIPDKFLRRWDAVTFFLDSADGPAKGGPEHHPEKYVSMTPAHPGVFTWLNARTLQFRPAEPWPALSRFSFRVKDNTYDLVTLMEVPTGTIPADREEGLDPVERISLTFAEPLDPSALRQMVRIGVRPLPGIDDSQTRWLDQRDFDLKVIERVQRRDPASYVLTLLRPIPSGQRVIVRLRLSLDDGASDSFKDISFTTSESFRIARLGCADLRLPITPEGVAYARDQALTCNADQRQVQVEFSADLKELSPVEARNLVRFTPAVKNLSFQVAGHTLLVDGSFQPGTLYRVTVMPMPLADSHGRPLLAKAPSQLYLNFPPKPRYLQVQGGHAIVERYGPQQLPLDGRGFERADVRVYPVDPLDRSFWPFPDQPVITDENSAPPAPGEEPASYTSPGGQISARGLAQQLRTLGSPPVSTLVKLPLRSTESAAHFGLDMAPHFAAIAGKQQPGTYLVGIRKLDEAAQRSWMRVQVTDLSLTTVEEENAVKFTVNSLNTGEPVSGAEIRVEGVRNNEWVTLLKAKSGSDGTYRWTLPVDGAYPAIVRRIVVQQGRDVLVLDPNRAPDRYQDNLWGAPDGTWLQWTQGSLASRSEQPQTLCHMFTERPVYRPEEKVYVKGYVRQRLRGVISILGGEGTLVAEGRNGLSWRYPVKLSAQGSFSYVFDEASTPTGDYHFHFEYKNQTECGSVSILKEAYRAPEFDVRLSAPDQVPLDREFKVQLAAKYYAGGQASGRPVRWRVTQFPYAWTPAARPGFFYSSDGRFSGRESFRGSPVMEREGTTDAQGAASLALNPATETTAQPRSYVVEATVTGADDQTVSATQRVLALPAVVLGLKTPRYIERAKSVTPEIIVVGPDGKLVAQQNVTVRLIKREWHSHLRADDFSQAEPKYVTEVVDRKISERQVKSGAEPLKVALALDGAGVYVIELETQDRLGRAQTVAVDLYAGGEEPVTWSRQPSDVFKVTPDKTSYVPGDTAHLVLESPFQQAHGLAIVETPDGNRYQWFTVNNGAATFDVVVQKNFTPRMPVHFVLMRGRIPGVVPVMGGRVDLGKPATVAATAWVAVAPVEHQVNVTLTYPERAKPGETVEVRISLSDRAGKPASGEVTLWLVDQAVLALGKEQRLDPIPDFITPVTSRVGIQDTRNWTVGILPWSENPGGDEGAAAEQDESLLDKVTLRRDFRSVPYFNPAIMVGSGGVATVTVKLPDNLTNFKLRAKAVSGQDRFGVATGQISVRLPVIVQPALPRFVRPGDRFTATAIGRIVEGSGGAGVAEMRAKGVELQGSAKKSLTLNLNEPQRIEYQVAVPTPPVSAQGEVSYNKVSFAVAVERTADKAHDAFEVQLPVRPDRSRLTQRKLIEIKPGATAEIPEIPEPARPGSLRRSLVASDLPALVRMVAGLSFLMEYPHGCTEQRVSRARAFLAFREFNARLYREGQDKELKRVVNEVLAWLPSVIDNNGLVSYWPGSSGYVSLTAWVTEFLVEARAAGFAVDQRMLDRLANTLHQALRSDYTHFITGESYTERVMALRALAAAGRLDAGYVAELARRTEYLNLESSADVWRLLNVSSNQTPVATDALGRKVWEGIVIRQYQGREIYGGLQETATARNGLILPSETRTLAEVTRAAASSQRPDPRLAVLIDALVTLGQGDGWGSTQADASAMLALSDVIKRQDDKATAQKLDVTIEGKSQVLEIGPTGRIAQTATNSPSKIELRSEGSKPLIVRAETSYLPQALGSEAPSGTSGFVVTREMLVQRTRDEPADKVVLSKPGTTVQLTVGDVVEEHVEVAANADHNYVAVVVPLAAGLEPLNPKLATAPPEATPSGTVTAAPSYVAYMDDQVAFYYDALPKGSYHFYFRTRATVPGQFTQPQARAELMYDGAVHGESVGARVEVKAKAK